MKYEDYYDAISYGTCGAGWPTNWSKQPLMSTVSYRPLLTLSEVNHLMRCAKKDKRLAKILEKALGHDTAYDIEIVFYAEDTVPEEE